MAHRLLLTFDIEDFINPNAISALHLVLEMFEKRSYVSELKAVFFITGHMAEKLCDFPEIVNLMKNHEIGFHSSSHSVRPIIPEYTDVDSYRKAYEISFERETSHINPTTGKPEDEGGIYSLQDLFHPKRIEAYRAPGMCWTPPHLEALRDLGIKFDFSSNVTASEPVQHRRITFYPYTFTQQWSGSRYDYECLLSAILKRKVAIFDLHPTLCVNQNIWDSIYYGGNPASLINVNKRPIEEVKMLFTRFELLLKRVSLLQQARLIETDPGLGPSRKQLATNKSEVKKCYEKSMRWPKKLFNYQPKFVLSHFYEFFEDAYQ